MELMDKIIELSSECTGKDSEFIPPITWATTDQASVNQVKELLMMSDPWDTNSGKHCPRDPRWLHNFSVNTSAKSVNKWCYWLCASIENKKVSPLLAPSWD
jgi:hypothetical protein